MFDVFKGCCLIENKKGDGIVHVAIKRLRMNISSPKGKKVSWIRDGIGVFV